MGIVELEKSVQHFMEAGLAESFKRVYNAGWQRYLQFCHKIDLPTIHITQEKATLFVAFLGAEGSSYSTVELSGCSLPLPAHGRPGLCDPLLPHPIHEVVIEKHQGSAPCMAAYYSDGDAKNQGRSFSGPTIILFNCGLGSPVAQAFGFLRCSKFLTPDGVDLTPVSTIP